MTDNTSIFCPWCGSSVEVRSAEFVPEFPKGFKWPAPCCKQPFVVTRYGGKLHVQKYTDKPIPPPPGIPS